jgi:hypothetical protein
MLLCVGGVAVFCSRERFFSGVWIVVVIGVGSVVVVSGGCGGGSACGFGGVGWVECRVCCVGKLCESVGAICWNACWKVCWSFSVMEVKLFSKLEVMMAMLVWDCSTVACRVLVRCCCLASSVWTLVVWAWMVWSVVLSFLRCWEWRSSWFCMAFSWRKFGDGVVGLGGVCFLRCSSMRLSCVSRSAVISCRIWFWNVVDQVVFVAVLHVSSNV